MLVMLLVPYTPKGEDRRRTLRYRSPFAQGAVASSYEDVACALMPGTMAPA